MYDGNGDRIFTLNSYDAEDYVTNGKGTAANVYSSLSTKDVYSYDRTMVKNELLIPNGITLKTAFEYELTGYINNINTEHTQVLMEFGSNGRWSNVYDYGINRNSGDIRSNQKLYYMYDGRGSVSNLTSNSGINMVYYEYGVFGETVSSADGIPNPYQYNAEYTDAATGLQYLRARYYDSEINRFLTKDTYLGETNEPLTKNLYAYANNNPINFIDPSGHSAAVIITVVAVLLSLGGSAVSIYSAHKDREEAKTGINESKRAAESAAISIVPGNATLRTSNNGKSSNSSGGYSYYNKREKKTVIFATEAEYQSYKLLCEELEELDNKFETTVNQAALDLIGFVPGMGEVADFTNACISLEQEDYFGATMSGISCFPVVGDIVGKGLGKGLSNIAEGIGKLGKNVNKFDNPTKTIVDGVATTGKNAGNIIDGVEGTAKIVSEYTDEVLELAERFETDPSVIKKAVDKGYHIDSKGRWHRKDGDFASYAELGFEPAAKSTKHAGTYYLRENMKNVRGIKPKPDHDAHHIVAVNDPAAKEAREILESFGIEVDNAYNGVYLPRTDTPNSTNHKTLHTTDYYEKVTEELRNAQSTKDVTDILTSIGDRLANGTF